MFDSLFASKPIDDGAQVTGGPAGSCWERISGNTFRDNCYKAPSLLSPEMKGSLVKTRENASWAFHTGMDVGLGLGALDVGFAKFKLGQNIVQFDSAFRLGRGVLIGGIGGFVVAGAATGLYELGKYAWNHRPELPNLKSS